MKSTLLSTLLLLSGWVCLSQPVVTLEQCYQAATDHSALGKQREVQTHMLNRTLANLNANRWLPQLVVNGQASWQSEVTQLPIELPQVAIPTLSKDQYRITADASYVLFDGQRTALERNVQRASTAVEQSRIAVDLHRLKDQVNTFFLQALITDEHIRLLQTQFTDLNNRMEKLRASIRFGTAAPLQLDALRAEALRVEGRLAELQASRRGFREQLALLTGLSLDDSTRLRVETPGPVRDQTPIQRPELALFQAQRQLADTQWQWTGSKISPRLSLFAQPGYGRPGLNFLNNDFRSYFIGGIRLTWNLSSAYTLGRERQLLRLSQQAVDLQQTQFEQTLSIQLRGQRTEIERLQALIEKDQEMVALRTSIRQRTTVQFDNGTLAVRDYTSELNEETQALLNQRVHEWQLTLAQVQYQTLTGK
jgi:outer membrane protein TolC